MEGFSKGPGQRRAASVEKEAGGAREQGTERGLVNLHWWRGEGFNTEAVQTQELCDFLPFSLFEKPADVTDRPHKHCDSVTLGNV